MDSSSISEVWIDLRNFEGLYKISNLGRVWSIHNNLEIKPFVCPTSGYLLVDLYGGSIEIYRTKRGAHRFRLHRLVGSHFLTNPEGYRYLMHIDKNKFNNSATNLRWRSSNNI